MAKKLLYKTTSSFLLYSVIILLVAAPVFYYICSWLYVYETDEVLLFHKGAFENASKQYTDRDISAWNRYNPNVEIVADTGVQKDSIVGKTMVDRISNEPEPFRVLYAPVTVRSKRYTYIEKANLVEMEGMVLSIALMFLVIIAILLVGISWISKASAAKIWRPFYDTLNQIRHFELDKNKPPQFSQTDVDEFNRLNKSVENLIEKNRLVFNAQREFIENAAHELQTPLALFQGKIENLLQTELSDEQSQILGALSADVGRLNRLNKNLLLLSKIEYDSFPQKQTVSLSEIVRRNLDFFEEQAQAKNIQLRTLLDDDLAVAANISLTEVLVNNLFLNAIRHNLPNGTIEVLIEKNTLRFSNTGTAGALDGEKLFNRFSKIDSSGQGNGLGLAIVKKIATLNGWTVEYEFSQDLHRFTVTFS